MADTKISGLTALTAPAVTDELAVVDDDANATKKITLANLLKVINGLTAETAPAGDDVLALYDTTGSTTDKVTAQALVGYLVTAAGDILYATAAKTLARLGIGTYGQYLGVNSGATAPAWTTQDGWIPTSATWTYASATTFTIAGDVTTTFTKGTKLKPTQTTAKYFYVVSSAYSDPNTTVTITGGTDYTLADAAITLPNYSYASNPQGFPAAFAYTPTGIAGSNVTLSGRFFLSGKRCFVDLYAVFTNTITFTTMPTLPIPCSSGFLSGVGTSWTVCGVASYYDAAPASVIHTIAPTMVASDTTVTIVRAADGEDMSASVPITWANGDGLLARFNYEI